jgi:hypothetical protein
MEFEVSPCCYLFCMSDDLPRQSLCPIDIHRGLQDCSEDPVVVSSGIESGLAACAMPEGACACTSQCEQFIAHYQRCLKPFQPFVIEEGFANTTFLRVIAACREPRLKQASGRCEPLSHPPAQHLIGMAGW